MLARYQYECDTDDINESESLPVKLMKIVKSRWKGERMLIRKARIDPPFQLKGQSSNTYCPCSEKDSW